MQLLDFDSIEELATIEISADQLEQLRALIQSAMGNGTAPSHKDLEDLDADFEALMEALQEDEEGTDAF